MKNTFCQIIKSKFKGADDFVCSSITVGESKVYYAYIENLVNKNQLNGSVVEAVKKAQSITDCQSIKDAVNISGAEIKTEIKDLLNDILSGFVLVFCENETKEILSCPCQGYEKRAVEEPPTSAVLKGPREGFVEDANTNLSLIRRKLKTPDLKIKEIIVGKYTNSKVCIVYINSIADKKVVNKIEARIKNIDIDGVLDSFYLQSVLEEKHSSLFKQVGNTEKPEVAVAKLLEGRVAIVSDGSPLVLTLPFMLLEDFQSSDDYYTHPMRASFVRILRLWGFILSIMLPGIYVALQSFHFALLPIDFLVNIQSSIKELSFPPLIEILIVLFLFEILNEASVRMPKYLGMALSIVGALVLGDTAVQAGIISSPSVIMVAISGITLYMVPEQTNTASIIRLFFTVIGGIAGFYGLLLGFVALTSYLMTFDSYGTPYFAPYAPSIRKDKKDGFIKKRVGLFITRPESVPNVNSVRQRNRNTAKEGR